MPSASEMLDELQAVGLKVLDDETCEKENRNTRKNYIRKFEICAKENLKDTCQGDSGGPLVCEGKCTYPCISKLFFLYKYFLCFSAIYLFSHAHCFFFLKKY